MSKQCQAANYATHYSKALIETVTPSTCAQNNRCFDLFSYVYSKQAFIRLPVKYRKQRCNHISRPWLFRRGIRIRLTWKCPKSAKMRFLQTCCHRLTSWNCRYYSHQKHRQQQPLLDEPVHPGGAANYVAHSIWNIGVRLVLVLKENEALGGRYGVQHCPQPHGESL
jgi:hypothetical protein